MKNRINVFSKDVNLVSDKEENLIKDYIDQLDEEDFENNFNDDIGIHEVMYLSSQPQNLLSWNSSINEKSSVLQIGGNLGELTSILCKKAKYVTTIEPNYKKAMAISKRLKKHDNLEIMVGNFNQIQLEKKYNIIVIIGVAARCHEIFGEKLYLKDIIKKLEGYLDENGRFIMAVDNKFGLKYFTGHPEEAHNKKFVNLLGYNNESDKVETYTKKYIEENLKRLGYKFKFFYPLPDFRLPNVIFSDEQLPSHMDVDKYYPYSNDKTDILVNEVDLYREILKDSPEQFTFFANSFLVEFSKNCINEKYKYISFNNLRKQEYRLITKISDCYVEKQIVNDCATKHYQNIKKYIEIMKNNDINTVDYIEDGNIKSKYIDKKYMLENVLINDLLENNNDAFFEKIKAYEEELKKDTFKTQNYKDTVFKKYNIEQTVPIENLTFIKKGLWDMTFSNCFYIDEKFYFFDQEWEEDNIPVEYIVYRSIIYNISLRRYLDINKLLEKLGLSQYTDLFDQLDSKLQEKIRDKRMWQYYNRNLYFDIDSTKQEMINIEIRSKAKDGAIESLRKEVNQYKNTLQDMQNKIKHLNSENNNLSMQINNMTFNRIKRRIKRIFGGKYGQKN